MSSGFNKFLETGGGDISGLQDGTQPVFSSTLSAANLNPSLPCKTDPARVIQSTLLDIADTTGLQLALDSKLANPMTANLDAGQFDIFDLNDIKIDTAGLGTDVATLEYNGTGNVTIDLAALASHVDSSSIPSVDERIVLYDGITGETIKQDSNITISSGAVAGVQSYSQLTGLHTITGSSGITLTASTNNVSLTTSVGDILLNSADDLIIDTVSGMDINTGGLTVAGNPVAASTSSPVANESMVVYDSTSGSLIKETAGILTVAGSMSGLTSLESSGNIDFDLCTTFSVDTTMNAANALNLEVQGGTTASLRIKNDTGTSASSILIDSDAGGVQIDSVGGTDIASGGLTIASNPVAASTSAPVANESMVVYDSTSGSLIKETAGILTVPGVMSNLTGLESSGDVDFSGDSFLASTSDDTAGAITLRSSGGTVNTILIECKTGTTDDAIRLNAGDGGVEISSVSGTNVDVGGLTVASNIVCAASTSPVISDTVPIWDGTSGGLLKESSAVLSVTGDLSGLIGLEVSGANNINLTSTLASDPSIVINANNALGGFEIQHQGTDRIKTNSTGLSFFNSAPIAKPTVSGERAGNAALADLLTDLVSFGLVTDSTTVGTSPGDVFAAGPFTVDNTLIRADTIAGPKNVQKSGVALDDTDNMSGLNDLAIDGQMTTGGNIIIDTTDGERTTRYGFLAGTGTFVATGQHVAIGEETLTANNTNFNCCAVGYKALENCTGNGCVAVGSFALQANLGGNRNIAMGVNALNSCTTGTENCAIGDHSQLECIGGGRNCSMGFGAGDDNTAGNDNTSLGHRSLEGNDNATGQNTTVGSFSYLNLQNGTGNIGLGYNAGVAYTTTESDNICIGNNGVITDNSSIRIGNATDHDFCQIPKELRIEEDGGSNYVGLSCSTIQQTNNIWELPLLLTSDDQSRTWNSRNGILSEDTSGPYPPGYIDDGRIGFGSTTTVSVVDCNARDDTNVKNLFKTAETITLTNAGVLGLQTSSTFSASTWYGIYIIGDTSLANTDTFLAIPDGTAFSQTGYDVKRLLGYVRSNGSTLLWDFTMHHKDRIRHIVWNESFSDMNLFGPAAGTAAAMTALDCSTLLPPLCSMADFHFTVDIDADTDVFKVQSPGQGQTFANCIISIGIGLTTATFEEIRTTVSNLGVDPADQNIEWGTSVTGNEITITSMGYFQNL